MSSVFLPIRPPRARGSLMRGLLAAALSAGAGAGHAADFSLGVGAGIDRGRGECVDAFACDRSSQHWKLFAGYRLGEAVELQAVWFDAGRFKGGDTTTAGTAFGGRFEVAGFALTAGYRWPLSPSWSVVARGGAASVRARFDYVEPAFGTASKTTLQPFGGIGVAYAVTPALRVGLDYDLTAFKAHSSRGSLQMLGLAAQYSF